ncbi:helix-turn-helix domain-containing protein [Nocardiopsis xinjiangensis]|uniref:helix-turn-helix domain-containing protein n=1 Tax=Nocardiopsis xinjiangensis TaxID=124285 RepID=UPI00034A02B5|nr:helix-turn-helix domain-containing protein [Nocardiopsis xinjiangensis]
MQLRFQYRLYPDPGQRVALARLFGCVRVVYNDALERTRPIKAANKLLGSPKHRIAEGPYVRVPKSAELSKALITGAKKTPERAWLSQVSAVPLQQVLRDVDRAWKAHEDSKTGQRKGPKVGVPRFKSRREARSATRPSRAGCNPRRSRQGGRQFTTGHYAEHASVLVRLHRVAGDELAELLAEAWDARAPR